MQTTFKLFFSFMLCLGLPLVSGCGGQGASGSGSSEHPSALVGTWVHEDEGTLELMKDGSGIERDYPDAVGVKIAWKVESGRLHISPIEDSSVGILVWNYMLSGTTLKLDGNSRNLTLKKQ